MALPYSYPLKKDIMDTSSINDTPTLIVRDCTVLGGSGFPFSAGDILSLAFKDHTVSCRSPGQAARFSLVELSELSVTGPGTVTTGGGFMGGGFGVEGAMQGIAIAGVLNALTTKKKIHTLVTLTTNFGELHLHYGGMDPGPLRIYLSDVFVKMRRMNTQWVQERDALIAAQLALGGISAEEAALFKSRLSSPPAWPNLQADVDTAMQMEAEPIKHDPEGICPNCDKVIPLHSQTCKYCNANFGEYASWKVLPLG